MSTRKGSAPSAIVGGTRQWTARSLESILAPHGFDVFRANSSERVLALVRRLQPDVILLDHVLPPDGGIELCRALVSGGEVEPGTPIVVTTDDAPSRETRLRALRAGAWDYLVLPLDAEELLLKLDCYVRAKSAADRLREASLVDSGTGLYSERGILRRARELAAEAARHERALACIAVGPELARDTDRGPLASLPVLPDRVGALGRLLEETTRESDVVGRMGSAEFLVLAPDTDVSGALRLADRLTRRGDASADEIGVSLRAGCYAVPNFRAAAVEPAELMVRATLALRQAQTGPDTARIQLFGATDPA